MKWFFLLIVICELLGQAHAIDRQAFTFTNYDLTVQVEADQHRLGVRGHITLRNDSAAPQKNAVLQISSSLNWLAVQIGKVPVQFVSQIYTSDIDHTGALSEAIVSLPQEVPPKGSIDLEVGYEGVIPPDITRLTRIGVPEDRAKHTDWDQISSSFTAVRGIGYVVWYPVATESASLTETDSVAQTISQWQRRERGSPMSVSFHSMTDEPILFNGARSLLTVIGSEKFMGREAPFNCILDGRIPTFVIGEYQKLSSPKLSPTSIYYFSDHKSIASSLESEMARLDDLIVPVGEHGGLPLQLVENPDSDAVPFASEQMLIMPFKASLDRQAELTLVYALALQKVHSPYTWIREGFAHYAQAAYLEQQNGRQAALDYLGAHNALLMKAEQGGAKSAVGSNEKERDEGSINSLLNAPDTIYLQAKAMDVFWMLHDMMEPSFKLSGVLLDYKYSEDHSPDYLEKVVDKNTRRDLGWFFEDWVYHDRGLPDFRVASVYVSEVPPHGYLVTVTVENLGGAGAEVSVRARMAQGDVVKRLIVHGQSKASIRMEIPMLPQEIVVNDGSVPEANMNNNVYQVPSTILHPPQSTK